MSLQDDVKRIFSSRNITCFKKAEIVGYQVEGTRSGHLSIKLTEHVDGEAAGDGHPFGAGTGNSKLKMSFASHDKFEKEKMEHAKTKISENHYQVQHQAIFKAYHEKCVENKVLRTEMHDKEERILKFQFDENDHKRRLQDAKNLVVCHEAHIEEQAAEIAALKEKLKKSRSNLRKANKRIRDLEG